MNRQDYDVLSQALAFEHQNAQGSKDRSAVRWVEQVALTITERIAWTERTFDPVKFILAACDVVTVDQLTPPVRREVSERFGTSTRSRLNTERPSGLKSDEEIRTSYWKESTGVDMVLGEVSDSVGVAAAAGHLMNFEHAMTLGRLVTMSGEELRAVPGLRLGPVTLAAIDKVKDLWQRKQEAEAGGPDSHARPGPTELSAGRTLQAGALQARSGPLGRRLTPDTSPKRRGGIEPGR